VRERLLVDWTRGSIELTAVLGRLRPNGGSSIATATAEAAMSENDSPRAEEAFDLAGDLGDRSALERLRAFQSTTDARLRAHVVVAMVRLGATDADARLLQDLEQLPAEWLPEYARILARISEPEVRKRLAPGLSALAKQKNVELALAAAAALLAWDPDQYVFRFLDALSAPTTLERETGARYLKRELRTRRGTRLTWLMRRALSRETRPFTRDRLRTLLDGKS
jgi:hypothetical protein